MQFVSLWSVNLVRMSEAHNYVLYSL